MKKPINWYVLFMTAIVFALSLCGFRVTHTLSNGSVQMYYFEVGMEVLVRIGASYIIAHVLKFAHGSVTVKLRGTKGAGKTVSVNKKKLFPHDYKDS